MTTLSVSHYCHSKKGPSHELRNRKGHRVVVLFSCQSRGPVNNSSNPGGKKEKGGKLVALVKLFTSFEKIGKRVKENLSPRQKGDWKDLLLMSLSFAVYVYISQKLVCAYYAWTSMPKQLW